MIFGGRELDEKNRIIQTLKEEKVCLQKALSTAEAAKDTMK